MCSIRQAWLVPLLILAGWSGGRLSGDEIYLTDGRVIEGEIVSAVDADIIDVRVGSAGLVAIQHFPRAKVLRVEHKVSARQTAVSALNQQIEKLNASLNASATDWWSLARKFHDRGELATAKDLAARVLILDRHHADARKLLGMVQFQGVWMRPNEIATARGESFFRGAWVTWSQQEETLADESRRKEEQTAQRKEREEQRRQARIAAAVAAESNANLQETYVSNYYRSPYGSYGYGSYGSGYGYGSGGGVYGGGVYGGGIYGGGIYGGYRHYCPPTTRWHVGASGGGSNSAWRFGWTGSSGGGYP